MEDRRKAHRVPYRAVITIDEVYNQREVRRESREIPIEILDISKGGIGFLAKEDLPLHYYFNAKIDLGHGRQFYSVLKILRKDELEESFNYGCEFTGLADILTHYIDSFEDELVK